MLIFLLVYLPIFRGLNQSSHRPHFFNSKNQNLEDTASVLFRNVALKPIVGMLGGLNKCVNDPANLGSDAFTGTGSSLPEGCNPQNGDGCALITGCNPITAQRCVQTPLDNNTMIIKDGKLNIQKGTTNTYHLPFSFGKKPDCFFSPPNWVCDNTSCWVCVSPDPKMGTPQKAGNHATLPAVVNQAHAVLNRNLMIFKLHASFFLGVK